MHANADPYAADYDAWINAQAVLLRTGRLQELDAEQLAEELEAMSRRERNELVSRLIILIAHLLKWQYQPAHRSSRVGALQSWLKRGTRSLATTPGTAQAAAAGPEACWMMPWGCGPRG